MKITEGKSLADLTTFRIGGQAEFFCEAKNKEDLQEAVDFAKEKKLPVFILGGGSNILISDKGFDGLVIRIGIKGIEELVPPRKAHRADDQNDVLIRVGAGENWDDFVGWSVEKGYGSLENLSLIPGLVGGAPAQNIGAYGVEVGDLIESVEAFDMKEGVFKILSRKECGFSYRDSMFKREKGRYVIVSILFKLKKNAKPDISYKDLSEYFDASRSKGPETSVGKPNSRPEALPMWEVHFPNGKWSEKVGESLRSSLPIRRPSIAQVRDAVIAIRTAKLPDVKKVGTAGSFFKNPILSKEKFAELKSKYSELPSFPESDGRVKIPIAWIIDKVCGLKGKKFGKAGIHDTQALVIVNHGDASFEDVEKVAKEIEKAVKEKTGIEIEREVIMV